MNARLKRMTKRGSMYDTRSMKNSTSIGEIRWAEYNRRSSDEGKKKQLLSNKSQTDELAKRYPENDFKRKHHIQESDSAFHPNNRPRFEQLMQLIEAGEINGIICWHPDRLSRNSIDAGRIVHLLKIGQLKEIKFGSYHFENTPEGRMFLQLALSQSEYYSDKLSVDVKRGNTTHLENGQWLGAAPPGYLNLIDPLTKQKYVDLDPERFPLLQKAGKLFLTGRHRAMEVLDILNNEWGYRSRKTEKQGDKPMSKSGFYKFLSNPFYFGQMIRSEGEFTGSHKSMFTESEFDRIQILLGRKGRLRNDVHKFPFKELLKCGECGGSVTCEEKWQIICSNCKTKFHKGKKTDQCPQCHTLIEAMVDPTILHYVYYHCTKRVNRNCTQGCISKGDLEKTADVELQKFEIDETFRDWAIEHLNKLNKIEVTDREKIRGSLKVAYDDCVKKIDNLLSLKISVQNTDGSAISEAEYLSQRRSLLEEKESLLERLNDVDQRQNTWLELSERTFNFALYARHWFAYGDLLQKTQILAGLGSNLLIQDKKLLIDRHKQLFLIEKGKKEAENLGYSFEPTKKPDLTTQSAPSEVIRSAWLRDRDSNPGTKIQSLVSYH